MTTPAAMTFDRLAAIEARLAAAERGEPGAALALLADAPAMLRDAVAEVRRCWTALESAGGIAPKVDAGEQWIGLKDVLQRGCAAGWRWERAGAFYAHLRRLKESGAPEVRTKPAPQGRALLYAADDVEAIIGAPRRGKRPEGFEPPA